MKNNNCYPNGRPSNPCGNCEKKKEATEQDLIFLIPFPEKPKDAAAKFIEKLGREVILRLQSWRLEDEKIHVPDLPNFASEILNKKGDL